MKKGGFSLIEVLIAIAIISVVAVAFMQALGVGVMGTHWVDTGTTALNLARSQMEYVKSQEYIVYNTSCNPILGIPYMTIGEIPSGYSVNTIVCEVQDADADILQHITVTATSQDGTTSVELEGYKTNSGALPTLRDLPFVETTDIYVPILPGTDAHDASRDGTCYDGRFLLFYGYPYVLEVTRPGALAVTWYIDDDESYGSGNLIDLYLYRNADFPNGDGRPDGPFFSEYYDYSWDTTFYNEEVGYGSDTTCADCVGDCKCADCTNGANWDDNTDEDYPRVVLMDNPTCYTQDARYCHDEEVPGWSTPWFCCSENPGETTPAPAEPGWIAHDEVLWPDPDTGNVLTTVLTREIGKLSGTVTFTLDSKEITGSGTSFATELEAGNLIKKSNGQEWYTIDYISSDSLMYLTSPSKDNGTDTPNATLYGIEIIPEGWYTIFFYNSNPIHNNGDCFGGAPQYCTNPRVFTVATEWASLSFYSEAP